MQDTITAEVLLNTLVAANPELLRQVAADLSAMQSDFAKEVHANATPEQVRLALVTLQQNNQVQILLEKALQDYAL